MIDKNGNENYQPCFIPLEGGIPEAIFGTKYQDQQLACIHYDEDANIAYFYRDNRKTPDIECLKVDLKKHVETSLGTSIYGNYCAGTNKDHSRIILIDGYTAADNVLYLWKEGEKQRELFFGVPIDKREKDRTYAPSGISRCDFTQDERGILFVNTLLDDSGSLGYLRINDPSELVPVRIRGTKHKGTGELVEARKIDGNRYLLQYNIDGCSWIYEATFRNGSTPSLTIDETVVGKSPTSDGVVLGIEPEVRTSRKDRKAGYSFSFTKATSPSQLYIFNRGGPKQGRYSVMSSERVLGISEKYLSLGEDASFTSFDGLRISARLYLPSQALGLKEPYPLALYVHGGPQGQERPDFTWFSMPLIQYLTLNGFAVFVPNVRGSTGYGLKFMKMIDHDWGGKDALDHLEGLKMLEKDHRVDSTRRGVIGRSYGGYMTLTLVSRFPEFWSAGVDMFGPYNLLTFMERLPPTWRTSFVLSIGDPDKDKQFLLERSPFTYIDNVKCPMLMIQGRNDPRVVERETADVVERLRSRHTPVDYLVFEDEGHDVIKFNNRVTCYNRITDFFTQNLKA